MYFKIVVPFMLFLLLNATWSLQYEKFYSFLKFKEIECETIKLQEENKEFFINIKELNCSSWFGIPNNLTVYNSFIKNDEIRNYFQLNESFLSLRKPIDREELCLKYNKNLKPKKHFNEIIFDNAESEEWNCPCDSVECFIYYKLVAFSDNNKNSFYFKIPLQIVDIDDHVVKFDRHLIEFNMTENFGPNRNTQSSNVEDQLWCGMEFIKTNSYLISLPTASDNDAGENSLIDYYLGYVINNQQVYCNNSFSLIVDHSLKLFLQINFWLDREVEDKYELVLMASSRTSPSQQDSIRISLNIIDLNDNAPIFEKNNCSIDEYEIYNSKISCDKYFLCVSAQDADYGINGGIKYSIVEQYFIRNPINRNKIESINDLFIINESNGCLQYKFCDNNDTLLTKFMDYETIIQHVIVVKASDLSTNNQLSSYTTASINIKDLNDNIPEIKYILNCNNITAYHLNDIINIENVSEESPIGSCIVRIIVFDLDLMSSNNILLNLSTTDFSIQKINNEIVSSSELIDYFDSFYTFYELNLNNQLNAELKSLYEFDLNIIDSGYPMVLSKSYSIVVKIKDENNNYPQFSKPRYYFKLNEFTSNDLNRTTCLQNIFATDLDISYENSFIEYKLEAESFAFINGNNQICLKYDKNLDRELNEHLFLTLKSINSLSNKQLYGKTTIKITLIDINDNPPAFKKTFYLFYLAESQNEINIFDNQQEKLTYFGTVKALDQDTNSELEYYLVNNITEYNYIIFDSYYIDFTGNMKRNEEKEYINDINEFIWLNRSTGELFYRGQVDRERVKQITFLLQVSDGLFNDTTRINLSIEDINDNRPECNQQEIKEEIKVLNSQFPRQIYELKCFDKDTFHNSELSYSISRAHALFEDETRYHEKDLLVNNQTFVDSNGKLFLNLKKTSEIAKFSQLMLNVTLFISDNGHIPLHIYRFLTFCICLNEYSQQLCKNCTFDSQKLIYLSLNYTENSKKYLNSNIIVIFYLNLIVIFLK